MVETTDARRFKRIDPLSHRTTTRERISRALLWVGGVTVFLVAFAAVIVAFFLYQSGMVS